MFALRPGRRADLAPDRARQPSRHPAHGRQVRRQPGRARRARGPAHAGGGRLRDQRADRGGELDQRGGRALRAGHAGLGRVRRRLQPGRGRRHCRHRRACASATALDGIGWRGEAKIGACRCRPTWSCTSSRGRSWRPRTRPSASSPACRACAGTRRPSPAAKATPAPRRCRGAPMRWWPAPGWRSRCRRSRWRMRRRRSAPSAASRWSRTRPTSSRAWCA